MIFATAACSTGQVHAAADWEEPGWMAAARQSVEEYQTAMLSCLEEHGVQGRASFGSEVAVAGAADEHGVPITGSRAVMEAAGIACYERVPRPEHWSAPVDTGAYDRMLDVRSCLVAHGIDVPEAPAREVWLEHAHRWNPWMTVFDRTPRLTDAELHTLMAACPQDGGSAMVTAFPERAAS